MRVSALSCFDSWAFESLYCFLLSRYYSLPHACLHFPSAFLRRLCLEPEE
ncbi:hypothetical protein GCWU000341_00165 [Oribacterium sp. oral taxon 078 str. F0262]|nr:hypothetical protein GCWU000341_00165 [Oribacterium sp. oral taxon 078 str. F0262]